jgi:hypothetical protein
MSAFIKQNQHRSPVQPDPLTATYTAISGAAGQTVTGLAIAIMNPQGNTGSAVQQGTLSARCTIRLTTNTITVTGKWQVSQDGSTWYDVTGANNAANVVLATGTGSLVTTNIVVSAHDACYGFNKARYVLTSGVASGGGAGVDEAAISHSYRTAYPG